jgi:tRNA(fMet)-specific endonuclease VapC
MSGRYLLDTNIVIALFAREAAVLEQLSNAEATLIPSIAVGELYYGARKSARWEANLARLDALVSTVPILPCDTLTARRYGQIKDQLRRQGQPIPENDIWIAALALEHALTLVTRDAHLSQVMGLSVVAW